MWNVCESGKGLRAFDASEIIKRRVAYVVLPLEA